MDVQDKMSIELSESQENLYFLEMNSDKIPSDVAISFDSLSASYPNYEGENDFESLFQKNLTETKDQTSLPLLDSTPDFPICLQDEQPAIADIVDVGNNVPNNNIHSVPELDSVLAEFLCLKAPRITAPLKKSSSPVKTNKKNKAKVNKKHDNESVKKSKLNPKVIEDYVHISDRIAPPRAVAVLPPMLQIKHDVISPCRLLPPRVRFGPVQGIKRKILKSEVRELVCDGAAMKTPVFFIEVNNGETAVIDTADRDKANWLCLLPVGDYESANVWLYEENNELYGFTTKYISAKKPLKLGYSKVYADKYKLPTFQPILDLTAYACATKKWSCEECSRTFTSAALMQRHLDFYHKNEPQPWRRYRCKQCSNSFVRLYTLKRHRELYCEKKIGKLDKATERLNIPNEERKVEPIPEEKIPSDESFQNFTNSLDLSASLFENDKMPDFDVTSNSRPGSEFNLYDIGDKDENSLINDIELIKFSEDMMNPDITDIDKSRRKFVVCCVYCKQAVLAGKIRQHIYECNGRRMECKCERVFFSKKRFIQHIYRDHRKDIDSKKDPKTSPEPKKFKCDQCQITFKRRGMLVNHMWRVHKIKTAAVPMERRVKHYLCVACPKIYGTAAKRNRHVRLHHPGLEKCRGPCVEGGVVTCQPAQCGACPRQYATRAKLLQHQRMHHPHLVPPSQPRKQKLNV